MTTDTQPLRLTDEYLKGAMARAVPGAFWSKDDSAWMLSAPTPRSAAVALRLFPELATASPWLCGLRDQLASDCRPFDQATPFDRPLGDTLAKLYRFQALDLGYVAQVLRAHGGAYIGWERGLGKTLGTCALIEELDCRRTLVVAPNTAKLSVWAAELAKWLPGIDVLVLPNEKRKRERMLRHVAGARDERFVLVIHYEALALIAGRTVTKGTKRLGDGWKSYGEWDLFVADEAHRLKNPKALMSKAAKKVPARMRLALSGSIIQNHAEELFSVLQWLFPAVYKSQWRDWNDRYLDYVESGYGKVCIGVKPDAIERLRNELGVFMVYRRKEDELDLPARIEQTMLVELSPSQRRVYQDLGTSLLAQLPDGQVVKAGDGLVLLTRLRQVASGLDLLSDRVADSSKLDLAVELIEDNTDEAFVVFSWYKAACSALAERLAAKGIEHYVITGDTAMPEREASIAEFQAGQRRVMIGTLSTMGESVNLYRASNAVFLDRSWNPALNAQAEDRIYRIGQTRPVTVTHLVAKDTVDEYRVAPTLASKEALRQMILGGRL